MTDEIDPSYADRSDALRVVAVSGAERLQRLADLESLGLSNSDRLADEANALRRAGIDCPALRRLSWLSVAELDCDRELLLRAVREAGVVPAEPQRAAMRLARWYARRLIDGEIQEADAGVSIAAIAESFEDRLPPQPLRTIAALMRRQRLSSWHTEPEAVNDEGFRSLVSAAAIDILDAPFDEGRESIPAGSIAADQPIAAQLAWQRFADRLDLVIATAELDQVKLAREVLEAGGESDALRQLADRGWSDPDPARKLLLQAFAELGVRLPGPEPAAIRLSTAVAVEIGARRQSPYEGAVEIAGYDRQVPSRCEVLEPFVYAESVWEDAPSYRQRLERNIREFAAHLAGVEPIPQQQGPSPAPHTLPPRS